MLRGYNIIGDTEIAEGEDYLQAFSPTHLKNLPEKFIVATDTGIGKRNCESSHCL